jgi:hypothetical protein
LYNGYSASFTGYSSKLLLYRALAGLLLHWAAPGNSGRLLTTTGGPGSIVPGSDGNLGLRAAACWLQVLVLLLPYTSTWQVPEGSSFWPLLAISLVVMTMYMLGTESATQR